MSTRLYVGNLSFRTTKDSLREAFAEGGREVVDVHVVTDRETGQSRGFGFVTLASADQAKAAMQAMNGAMLDGRPLRVNEAEDRPPRGAGGGGGAYAGGGGGYGGPPAGGGGYGAPPPAGGGYGAPPAGGGSGRRGGGGPVEEEGRGGGGRGGRRGGGGGGGGRDRDRW